MLKLMNTVLLLIFCGEVRGETLNCDYDDLYFDSVNSLYTCTVTSLDNSYNNLTIEGENNNNIEVIWIHDTNTKYIPANLGSYSKLVSLIMHNSQLVEIKAENFQGMQNLERLSLMHNKLTSVPSDVFSKLTKLKEINLWHNQIKYIEIGAFDQLMNLNKVYLLKNICINKEYKGATAITQMKHDIKENCITSTERMLMQMEKNFINEVAKANEKNQGELKALNEMMKQLLIESKDHKMEHQENIKLKAELSAAKEEQKMAMDQQKKEQEANTKVVNKRDQLEMKLTEAKSIIDHKLPKMEQLIEDFYMEVMDLKIERHNERQNSIALRSKLMEANEKLATCEINERSLV